MDDEDKVKKGSADVMGTKLMLKKHHYKSTMNASFTMVERRKQYLKPETMNMNSDTKKSKRI
jgi:hypothetical protein